MKWYPDYQYVLGSRSPRRQQLLAEIGLPFIVRTQDIEEDFPDGLAMAEIPVYLALRKADALMPFTEYNEMLITADTIVWLDGEVLGKPGDCTHAREILSKLSGKVHQVVTGVCLQTKNRQKVFYDVTDVSFRILTPEEIEYYIENYKPFDKAGAYGIQEWIGLTGISGINGSYFNVVGLPVQKVYQEIINFKP